MDGIREAAWTFPSTRSAIARPTVAGAAVLASAAWTLFALFRGAILWTPAFALALSGFAWTAGEQGAWERRGGRLFFWGACAVYLSTFRWHGGDDIPTSLLPFSLLRHGTFYLDEWVGPFLAGKSDVFTVRHGGHYLSFYPVASAVLSLPVYAIPALAGVPVTEPLLHNLSKVSATLITAVSVGVFYQAVSARSSRRWAAFLTAFYAFGTWSFSVSSQALYQHAAASLGQALGVLGLSRSGRRWDVLAGLGLGLAVASRPDTIFVAAAVALYLAVHRRERVAGFAAGALVPAAMLSAYWLVSTGRLTPTDLSRQGGHFGAVQPAALIGMLASPTRGIVWFSPFLLFGAWNAFRREAGAETRWLAAGCIATWLFFGSYRFWTGGSSFGPRYLAGVAVPLAFACGGIEPIVRRSERLRGLWGAAGALSILVHAMGAYLNWPGSSDVAVQQMELWTWRLHPIACLMTDRGGLSRVPFMGRAALLACLSAASIACARRAARALRPQAPREPAPL